MGNFGGKNPSDELGVEMNLEEAFVLSLACTLFSIFVIYVQAYLKSPLVNDDELREEIEKSH